MKLAANKTRRYFKIHEHGTGREEGFFVCEREARIALLRCDRLRPQYTHELRWVDATRLPRDLAPEAIE